jgi:hypothetical protein
MRRFFSRIKSFCQRSYFPSIREKKSVLNALVSEACFVGQLCIIYSLELLGPFVYFEESAIATQNIHLRFPIQRANWAPPRPRNWKLCVLLQLAFKTHPYVWLSEDVEFSICIAANSSVVKSGRNDIIHKFWRLCIRIVVDHVRCPCSWKVDDLLVKSATDISHLTCKLSFVCDSWTILKPKLINCFRGIMIASLSSKQIHASLVEKRAMSCFSVRKFARIQLSSGSDINHSPVLVMCVHNSGAVDYDIWESGIAWIHDVQYIMELFLNRGIDVQLVLSPYVKQAWLKHFFSLLVSQITNSCVSRLNLFN